jgi:hypothetical protein
LRATLDGSYLLLDEANQALFRHLSVFSGGWTLEAAEAVCGVGVGDQVSGVRERIAAPDTRHPAPDTFSVLERLTGLIDQSVVSIEERGHEVRYHFLETIRTYAAEKLRESGEEELHRARHCDWFLALAERSWPELTRHDQVRWFEILDAEAGNLRVALDWCRTSDTGGLTELRLAGALGRYWHMHHFLSEGSDHLERSLARASREPSQALALATNWAGRIAATQGRYSQAKSLLEESVAVSRAIGDESLLSLAFRHLAIVEQALGQDHVADEHLVAALAEAERVGDARETGWNLTMLGHRATQTNDLSAARQQLERALRLLQHSGDRSGIAYAQSCLSRLEAEEGNLARARVLVDSAAMTAEDLELRRTCVNTMGDAVEAILALQAGDLSAARRHVRDALQVAKEHGEHETCIAALLADAGLLAATGNLTEAVRAYGVVAAQSAATRVIAQIMGRDRYESALAALRMRLGSAAFDDAWSTARNSTPEQAIDDALRASADTASSGRGRT